jgi:hypothetical protein
MSSRQRHAHIWDADPYGHYPDPPWVSRRLLEAESFSAKGALILDPCCGWGRIPHNATAAGYTAIGVEIVDRRREPLCHNGFKLVRGDFLKDTLPVGAVESAVFNPPYIQQFVECALAIVKYKVAALIPLRRLPAAHWIEGKPLETIWLLTPRPSLPPASYIRAGHEPGSGAIGGAWSGDINLELDGQTHKIEVKAQREFCTLHGWLAGADLLLLTADRQPPLAILPVALLAKLLAGVPS